MKSFVKEAIAWLAVLFTMCIMMLCLFTPQ